MRVDTLFAPWRGGAGLLRQRGLGLGDGMLWVSGLTLTMDCLGTRQFDDAESDEHHRNRTVSPATP